METIFYDEILTNDSVFLLELSENLPRSIDNLKIELSSGQIEKVADLYQEGLVYLRWNDNIPHQNYQELDFTLTGLLSVYKVKYAYEIEAFKEYLNNNGYTYNNKLIDDFLIISDLSKEPETLLTVDNLLDFSNIYDRYIGK